MLRLSAEQLMAEVLGDGTGGEIPPLLRARLLQVAQMGPAVRVRELKKAFAGAARG